jgi:hypothetical protein
VKIETGWFHELIRMSPYGSIRGLAPRLRNRQGKPMDPGTLSLMLRGKRAMQLEDARQIADVLGVSLGEVLRHAGLRDAEVPPPRFQVHGSVGTAGEVRLEPQARPVEGPADLPSEAMALRGRGEFEGWLFYAGKALAMAPKFFGRLAIVELRGGRRLLGYIGKGGVIRPFGPGRDVLGVSIKWVSPVLWIRPSR